MSLNSFTVLPLHRKKKKTIAFPIKQFSISILKTFPFHALTPSKCFVYSHASCQEWICTFLAIRWSSWKKYGDASLSPPSAWIGSTTIPATGLPLLLNLANKSSTWNSSSVSELMFCIYSYGSIMHNGILVLSTWPLYKINNGYPSLIHTLPHHTGKTNTV